MLTGCFSADLSQVWPEANQHFSKEIDDEANSYFQRIYNHPPHPTMSVDEVSVQDDLICCLSPAILEIQNHAHLVVLLITHISYLWILGTQQCLGPGLYFGHI